MVNYFFDTYALYEIIEGNPDYARFSKDIGIITTKLNLMELYYGLLASAGKEAAEKAHNFFSNFIIEIDDEAIKEAMSFKLANKKRNFSYIDCLGYILAMQRCIKFLTGDEQFKEQPNVEFVK